MAFNFYFTAICISLTFVGESQAGGFYNTSHDVMVETIREGQASGVMGGDMAKKFEQQFKSNGALLFEARKLYSYRQSGCARIAIDYTKKGISTPNGLIDLKLNTQINYCLDGRAPQSLEKAA